MEELIFVVENAPEGGYTARALGESIFTEADDLPALREQVKDAVRCHFDDGKGPRVIRLHYVREEVFAA
ncbi:MAG TPA: hypothetical protein VGO68_12665 [Pyrinomonadaceae bacterium]|jgi:hypothetical protein|nr:hypothetical protein [Pyrinomonadaceae bacterium]